MSDRPAVRRAEASDVDTVSSILLEAAAWLEARGMPMWRADELHPEASRATLEPGCSSSPASTGTRLGRSSSSCPTRSSGPTNWAIRARTCTGSPCAASSPGPWRVVGAAGLGRRSCGRAWAPLSSAGLRGGTPSTSSHLRGLGFEHHSDRQVGPISYPGTNSRSRGGAGRWR